METVLDLTRDDLGAALMEMGHPRYRGEQIFRWLHARGVRTWDAMTDLPASLRTALAERWSPVATTILETRASKLDEAVKYRLALADNREIEAVWLPQARWIAACLSSQVGCAYKCVFCATGLMGLGRNLTPGEIVDQVRILMREKPKPVLTNLVLMGMGEPMANLEAVLTAIRILTDPAGLAFVPRRVTVSTSGLPEGIRKLAASGVKARLAVSLHAADDETRVRLVPHAMKWPLSVLMAACKDYSKSVPRLPVTFEYVMLDGVNDSAAAARRLVKLLHGIKSLVDLIPWNPVPGLPYRRTPQERIVEFQNTLTNSGILTRIRKSKGQDIAAACGQLVLGQNSRTSYELPGNVPGRVVRRGRPSGRPAVAAADAR